MIVCHCSVVTDKDVVKTIDESGAKTLEQVKENLDICNDCKCCESFINELLADVNENKLS